MVAYFRRPVRTITLLGVNQARRAWLISVVAPRLNQCNPMMGVPPQVLAPADAFPNVFKYQK
jgi:hypothetical protein